MTASLRQHLRRTPSHDGGRMAGLLCGMILVAQMMWPIELPAQEVDLPAQGNPNIFNIRFNSFQFQGQSFSGFSFRNPTFRPLPPNPIPFQQIQFRGLNAPVQLRRRDDLRRSGSSQRENRFVFRSREVVKTSTSEDYRGRTGPGGTTRIARREPPLPGRRPAGSPEFSSTESPYRSSGVSRRADNLQHPLSSARRFSAAGSYTPRFNPVRMARRDPFAPVGPEAPNLNTDRSTAPSRLVFSPLREQTAATSVSPRRVTLRRPFDTLR